MPVPTGLHASRTGRPASLVRLPLGAGLFPEPEADALVVSIRAMSSNADGDDLVAEQSLRAYGGVVIVAELEGLGRLASRGSCIHEPMGIHGAETWLEGNLAR